MKQAIILAGTAFLWSTATSIATAEADLRGHADVVAPFFEAYCVKCHGPEKQKGKITLHDLTGDVADPDKSPVWESVYEMLSLGDMPPEEEKKRPASEQSERVAAWIRTELEKNGKFAQNKRELPANGNYVDHDALFNHKPTGVPMPARLWRIRPATYDANVQSIAKGEYATPFNLNTSTGGFQDYANLYKLDDGTLGLLLGNAQSAAKRMTAFKVEGGKIFRDGLATPDQFLRILDPANTNPTDDQLAEAIDWQFGRVLQRPPTDEERACLLAFTKVGIGKSGNLFGLRNMIAAVLLTPEALYRTEIGEGEPDAHGRVRLTGREIAYAIAYALTDRRPDDNLLKAADSGQLATAAQVGDHVTRLFADPKTETPRILGFFREYFGYAGARDVFKDEKLFPQHRPDILVADTDRLILHILGEDKDVFRQLLTTQKSFVNFQDDAKTVPPREVQRMVHLSYNLPPDWKFDPDQPIELPGTQRAGILTQPSWLVANSDNFDNHIIHRGKWVREHLLGGRIPDLPITVDAKLPDEKHETLRHRMRVTEEEACWKCHAGMNPLGDPFEMFDHFGRWRLYETVLDLEATEKNVNSNGEPQGEIFTRVAFDPTGIIEKSGDPALEGKVENAIGMIHKLAGSDRVRQVFIRHVFRYFMGRNENLGDASTLQAADKAYVESGGSFKALVTSLLASDSFLYRVR